MAAPTATTPLRRPLDAPRGSVVVVKSPVTRAPVGGGLGRRRSVVTEMVRGHIAAAAAAQQQVGAPRASVSDGGGGCKAAVSSDDIGDVKKDALARIIAEERTRVLAEQGK
jgi:hypothetical protein